MLPDLLKMHQDMTFEKFSLHCQTYSDLIPVSFVLGFYVSIVIKRWWDQYLTIPWPDALAVYVSTFISGQVWPRRTVMEIWRVGGENGEDQAKPSRRDLGTVADCAADDRARLMRRTIMRYANLSLLLALRMMSPTVKKRFPTLEHLVEAGFLLKNEKDVFEKLETKTHHPKYWLPLVWATSIARRARREGKIPDDFALKTLIDEVVKFRGGCGGLLNFDWISIPLVYTQVVTLAVYSFFAAALMGNQYLDPTKGYPKHPIDLVIPVFTFLQFFFYMGWLLVAETLVNPFGEDDDDFEVNWLIDRNLQISYVIVDEMHEEHPELIKDQYWDQVFPSELPYTEAAKQYYMEPFLGSAFGVEVPDNMQTFVMISDQVKDTRGETTPVLINRPMGTLGDSLSGIQLLGSSMSLKKWKRPWKPFSSHPYSMNSVYKVNEDDYPDDVFSMSGLSFGSNRFLATKISFEKDRPALSEKVEIKSRKNTLFKTKLVRSVSTDGINPSPSNSFSMANNEQVKGEGEEPKTESISESNKNGAMQIWKASTDPRPESSRMLDLEYIKNPKSIECGTLEYDTINILFPKVETLLGKNSEAIETVTVTKLSKKTKGDECENSSEEDDSPAKYNIST